MHLEETAQPQGIVTPLMYRVKTQSDCTFSLNAGFALNEDIYLGTAF